MIQKAAETLRQLEKCFAVLGEENMPFRTISMREDFSDSVECDNIIRHCNSIEDKKLSQASTVSGKQCANRSTATRECHYLIPYDMPEGKLPFSRP